MRDTNFDRQKRMGLIHEQHSTDVDDDASMGVKKTRERETLSFEEKREIVFQEVVNQVLFDQFEGSMYDVDYSDEQIDEFFKVLAQKNNEEIHKALSMPYELQKSFFERNLPSIQSGSLAIEDLVDKMVKLGDKYGYGIGYHISTRDFQPQKVGNREVWDIHGTEKDHRDNDLMRAYYSLDYKNLYREKGGKYLYLIRIETGENSSHKRDNDGTWGRASQLSIIAQVDVADVDRRIAREVDDNKKAA